MVKFIWLQFPADETYRLRLQGVRVIGRKQKKGALERFG